MKVKETHLKGCFIIEPAVFKDARGSFFESFHQKEFEEKIGAKISFVQENQSISRRGVIRGLHMQKGTFAQAKLVRVIQGKVLDVAVDVRKNSDTFGQHFSCILSSENNKQLFVPRGFLHGFATLEDQTIFAYKCDNYYHKPSEVGVFYTDADLNIDWILNKNDVYISEKDKILTSFIDFQK
ncbi:MAG: dTDP-4-dehydrorhamnose 3,5-epimerase [Polaribacter sp.]